MVNSNKLIGTTDIWLYRKGVV